MHLKVFIAILDYQEGCCLTMDHVSSCTNFIDFHTKLSIVVENPVHITSVCKQCGAYGTDHKTDNDKEC